MAYQNMMEILKALRSGETTLDAVITDLESAKSYIRRGKTYFPLTFENLSNVAGHPANVYALGDGIDITGKAVEKRQRKPKSEATAKPASNKR